MILKWKKFLALFMVLLLTAFSGNVFAKKRGADLLIQKKDGQQIRGELIAVKQNALLLLEHESGADTSVDINHIKDVTINKKSKVLLGAGLGLLIGSCGGALVGSGMEFTLSQALVCAGLGALTGGVTGVVIGQDKTIPVEGKSDWEVKEILDKLRKKARVPDYK